MGTAINVVLAPAAVADVRAARDHYAEVSAELADAFVEALGRVVERLTAFPRSGTMVEGFSDLRRARMRRFPYGVFYQLSEPAEVRIVRVLHDRQDRPRGLDHPEP
ncbi:MAG: type II toxin-antitoxin system RelE/ParE family toxin [Austwickia sp.]|nr:MAG: type II toxin-antitoxin system RelE/ParE family toxin [Austwickia sp.]